MSKLETNTIDTVSGTSTLTIGSSNTSTIAFKSGASFTGLGNYVIEKITDYEYAGNASTTSDTSYIDIAGGNTINFTPTSTSDVIILSGFCLLRASVANSGAGLGIMQSTSSSITSSDTVVMRDGRYGELLGTSYTKGTVEASVTGLSAGTTYYFEMFGMAYFGTGITYFNYNGTDTSSNARHKLIGVHYKYIG